MRKAFTIVELLIAMGLFGMLLAASGVIFATAVNAHRTAEATTEISQKLAAITDQLNADFRGLQKDCPIAIWFEVDPCDPCNPDVRYDQILFFASGDFQSYGYNSPPFTGNTARVYYGQANIIDYPDRAVAEGNEYLNSNILARRQHIYSSDPYFSDPCHFFPTDPCAPGGWLASFDITSFADNDRFEHDNITFSQWKVITNDPCNNNDIITTCFDNTDGRPGIDIDNAETLHMFMAPGVSHFQIQWAYPRGGQLRWWPSTDPDGDGDDTDSDFEPSAMNRDKFGIYFNMPTVVDVPPGATDWLDYTLAQTQAGFFPFGFFPEALKFTFTLYDSKGVFGEGKTFTHIVYLDD